MRNQQRAHWRRGRVDLARRRTLLQLSACATSALVADVFGKWEPYRRYVDRRTVFDGNDPIAGSVLCDVHENGAAGVRASAVVAVTSSA